MDSRMLQLVVVGSVVFAMLSASAAAQLGVPHQFFGKVTINGAAADDGNAVSARIGGKEVSSTTTLGGTYGLLPGEIFYIEDPDGTNSGKTIEFYVSGIKAAEYVFTNFESTELNLAVTVSKPKDDGDDNGGGGGSSSGGYTPPASCEESWSCSEWSACSQDGRRFRSCTDANSCGTNENEPIEEETCVYTPQEKPTICSAGTRVCVGDDLRECPDGTYWNTIESCEFGCDPDAVACKTETGEVRGAFDGLTGFLAANTVALYGLLVVLLVILGGTVYFKKYR